MQVSDCHWFSLNESPTNIILFPLSLDKKSLPLNLHEQIKRVSIKMLGLYIYICGQKKVDSRHLTTKLSPYEEIY